MATLGEATRRATPGLDQTPAARYGNQRTPGCVGGSTTVVGADAETSAIRKSAIGGSVKMKETKAAERNDRKL
jgi:hypothetical protein